MTTVVVVDDHPVFRRGLTGLLEMGGFEILGEAAGAAEAIAAVEQLRPALVVMDLGLPDGSGIDATAAITGAHPHIRVLVVSLYDDTGTVRRALAAGASGYVVKDAAHGEILAAARAAALGAIVLGSGVGLPGAVDTAPNLIERYGFTPREAQVADLMVRGLSNRQIAERLGIAGKTVSNLMSSVIAKTCTKDRIAAAARIRADIDIMTRLE